MLTFFTIITVLIGLLVLFIDRANKAIDNNDGLLMFMTCALAALSTFVLIGAYVSVTIITLFGAQPTGAQLWIQ